MARSMTGHGRGTSEAPGGARRVTVEIRAVNHRFLDVKLRSSGLDPRAEEAIGAAIRRRAERGAFSVAVRDEGGRAAPRVDLAAARLAHAALDELRGALGYAEPVPLALVLTQPGVLAAPAEDDGGGAAAIGAAADAAMVELAAMRAREGAALAADLVARIERIGALAEEIAAVAAAQPGELRRKLDERLAKLLGASPPPGIDEARLAQEVALLADRADVTEELVRLRAHVAAIRAHAVEDAAVGRRLDFLVQEVGRELNTIGSKSPSIDITRRVVDAKAELEKVREQVQNVE
jgi:uncharacterized protein (TIGR00255 family)